jgi:ATP-dependent DNA helicase Rep
VRQKLNGRNVQEFIGWLTKKGEDSTEFGNERDGKNLLELTQMVSLMSMLEGREDGEPDAVKLSTLHAAKGLEFGHVFLVGVEEGILPHRESVDTNRIEEERRLMYVGITRAQKSLNISWCKKRKRAGEMQMCEPSRFISELPTSDVKHFGNPFNDPDVSREFGKSKMANIRAMLTNNTQINSIKNRKLYSTMPYITLDNASLAFGHHALLDHASFQLRRRRTCGLNWTKWRR